jgi:DNA repair protein RadD
VILRPYQRALFESVRSAFGGHDGRDGLPATPAHDRVFMSLPCGGGKTAIFSAMAAAAREKGRRVWICLPRHELMEQASDALTALDVPHGRIAAGRAESRAFALHLVSSNTLIRRWEKIINPPDFIILDEAHLYYDRQVEICEHFPRAKILGVSASPERLDGRGLSDIYGALVEGPDIRELVETGYLCGLRYYAPPLDGLGQIHRRGFEFDEGELAELFARRKVYGQAVEHYERHARGKSALVFARSVDEAGKIAAEFRDRGWRFEPVSAETPKKERAAIIGGLKSGELHGVVNVEVGCYGLDVPRIECVILLRPTMSKALQTQMVGRGLRTSPQTGKRECVILDHVNLIDEHGHPFAPYVWQFNGREKRARKLDPTIRLRLCPETAIYCERPSCVGCENNTTKRKTRAEAVVDCQLRELAPPVEMKVRPVEEQAVFRERLDAAMDRAGAALKRGEIDSGAVGELLALARQLDRQPLWIYHRLCTDRLTVCVPLLAEIARQESYKPYWVKFKADEIRARLEAKSAGNRRAG